MDPPGSAMYFTPLAARLDAKRAKDADAVRAKDARVMEQL